MNAVEVKAKLKSIEAQLLSLLAEARKVITDHDERLEEMFDEAGIFSLPAYADEARFESREDEPGLDDLEEAVREAFSGVDDTCRKAERFEKRAKR